MMNNILVILDYSNGTVNCYHINSEVEINESYIEKLGYHTSNCEWMHGEDISFIFHKEFLK